MAKGLNWPRLRNDSRPQLSQAMRKLNRKLLWRKHEGALAARILAEGESAQKPSEKGGTIAEEKEASAVPLKNLVNRVFRSDWRL
ncbi:hypothetical protein CEXT_585421 [Caerostris extrusa]|uniref:Uncharacterized protein n=1 Tax=Caerostris extrusa TaxID=172846 RepID=A0AAV4PGT3_CAEEX|nr:hypothetical protein CEXT_585421 [Caerostris extrusa]